MLAEPLQGLATPLDDLTPLEGNPRRGDVAAVARSLARFGQRKPIVARRDGTVVAGNHTLAAARELGWSEIAVVRVDDDEATAKAYALADNRTSALGSFDSADLAAMVGEVFAVDPALLEAASFDETDLNELLAGREPLTALNDPDEVPEPPAEPVSTLGDLWLLGPHRLLCGDASDMSAHDQVLAGERPSMIFTDPPYGMNLQTDYSRIGHGKGRSYVSVEGDDEPYDASSLIALYEDVPEQFWWGADYYRSTIPDGGSWFVWDKRYNDQGMDLDKLIGNTFELCWSRQKHRREVVRVLWAMVHGTHRAGEDAGRGLHPTQKPTALVRWFFDHWGTAGDVVADFYGGSGSTLITAHQVGRRARLVELDPRYVDVICRRFQEHTGVKPVLESSGEPHDFTA